MVKAKFLFSHVSLLGTSWKLLCLDQIWNQKVQMSIPQKIKIMKRSIVQVATEENHNVEIDAVIK